MVPMVKMPRSTRWPPTQKTSADPTAPTRLSPRRNQRPTRSRRTLMSRTWTAQLLNLSVSSDSRPKILTRSAPLTLSVSFIRALISALSSICWSVIRLRMRPIRRDGRMNSGRIMTPKSVSRHSSDIITISVLNSETTFVVILISVPVTACCAPFTSLFIRDISSPVLVLVKKRILIRCIWAYSARRRSHVIPSPTLELK